MFETIHGSNFLIMMHSLGDRRDLHHQKLDPVLFSPGPLEARIRCIEDSYLFSVVPYVESSIPPSFHPLTIHTSRILLDESWTSKTFEHSYKPSLGDRRDTSLRMFNIVFVVRFRQLLPFTTLQKIKGQS